jgi:uncharacterized protein (DUF2147 family)
MAIIIRTFLIIFSIVLTPFISLSQDAIEKKWFNEEKTAKIQIYKATDGKYYGKIVWLKEPLKNGKPKVDENNPKELLRKEPLLGLLLLKGFRKEDEINYEGGTIYDPKNGKTYSCIIKNKGSKLDVRGYIGFSLIGRTTTWTLIE